MSFFDPLKNQFRSVIQWTDPSPEQLFYQFTRRGDEIKNASKLIVGPGQGCIFVYEGKIEGHVDEETMLDLKTDNHPFITTLRRIMQLFESEHKTGLFFYRKAHMLDRRWGTVSPIKYLDPVYKFPVGLSAFGNYSIKITEPLQFFKEVVAGAEIYCVREIQEVFLSRITQPMTDLLANAKFSYIDIDAHRNWIAEQIKEKTREIFTNLGFELLDFRVEGTTFDADTFERISRIADATSHNLAAKEVGLSYAELQQLNALRDAAQNEGGLAGAGLQMGAGLQLGQQFAQQNQPAKTAQPENATDKLRQLKALFDEGLITEEEFSQKKQEVLKNL